MCGIAGILGVDLKDAAENVAQALCSQLGHRGPDRQAFIINAGKKALLAHTRLSIIDPSERSAQPMISNNRYHLLYNGEVYNFRMLRNELEKDGTVFETGSDTEVILRLFMQYGSSCFSLLRGMFAIAIWDSEENHLCLSRDAFGMKPLYIWHKDRAIAFASETRALMASGLIPPALSPEGLQHYLTWGFSGGAPCLIRDVNPLPPGHVMEWRDGRSSLRSFSTIPMGFLENNATVEEFRRAWIDSVESHFISDVPVGLFLSGGVDSASVLAAARISGNSPSLAITLHFPGILPSEASHAKELAATFKVRHYEHTIADQDVAPLFESHLRSQDLPSMDGFNIYCVSQAARLQGLKVILTGLGGDELLGGYPSFYRIPLMLRARSCPPLATLSRSASLLLSPWKGTSRWGRLVEWSEQAPDWISTYRCYRGIFPQHTVRKLADSLGVEPIRTTEVLASSPSIWIGDQGQVAQLEFQYYLQQQLLHDGDTCSMAHGVELRHPFLDATLWRTAASLRTEIRFSKGKYLLRECLPEVPEYLFSKNKQGFALPYETWFKGPLRPYEQGIPDLFKDAAGKWYQKIALISLFDWMKRHSISI